MRDTASGGLTRESAYGGQNLTSDFYAERNLEAIRKEGKGDKDALEQALSDSTKTVPELRIMGGRSRASIGFACDLRTGQIVGFEGSDVYKMIGEANLGTFPQMGCGDFVVSYDAGNILRRADDLWNGREIRIQRVSFDPRFHRLSTEALEVLEMTRERYNKQQDAKRSAKGLREIK